MANRLKMGEVHAIVTLRARGWSFRRIGRELGVHRETAARYARLAELPPEDKQTTGSGYFTQYENNGAFLLAESLSSVDSADASAASLFADVAGTTNSSDFLLASMSAVPPVTFADRSARRRTCRLARRKPTGSPGSRVWSFHTCTGSQTPPHRGTTRHVASCRVLPSTVRTAWARESGDFGAQYPACVYPLAHATPATSPSPA